MLKATDLAYIAGFFDGEGSIYFSKTGEGRYTFLEFSNTDKKVLQWIKDLLGVETTIAPEKLRLNQRNVLWKLYIYSQPQVKLILRVLLPYLKVKRKLVEQHLLILESCEMNRKHDLPPQMADNLSLHIIKE